MEFITDKSFIDKTGKTHGIRFKIKPPQKAIKTIETNLKLSPNNPLV